MYRPTRSATSDGEAPLQSSEGLSIGVELTIRYALDPQSSATVGANLPHDIEGGLVDPLLQGVIYRVFTRYTVREIFSSKRQELQEAIESELKPLLATDGLILRQVMMGNVDLPADYRAGMDQLLAVELENREDAVHAAAEGKAGQARPSCRARPKRCAGRRPPRRRQTNRSSRRRPRKRR